MALKAKGIAAEYLSSTQTAQVKSKVIFLCIWSSLILNSSLNKRFFKCQKPIGKSLSVDNHA